MFGAVSTSGAVAIIVPTGVAVAAITMLGVYLNRRRKNDAKKL